MVNSAAAEPSMSRVAQERDFYRSLLELNLCAEPEPLVSAALDALLAVTGARGGYLELRDPDDETVLWSAAAGFDGAETAQVRRRISSGVMAEAIATGRTLRTASARTDVRFEDFESVRSQSIESVLCTPIGASPPLGAAYLAGRSPDGEFGRHDEECVAFFGRTVAPMARAFLARSREDRAALQRPPGFEAFIGKAPGLLAVLNRLHQAASLDAHLLLGGPSGSGKSMLAEAVHQASHRARGPFVEINCAALPEALVESELFGAERGAHSAAAHGAVAGKVAAASGGTLFLDEIAELSVQAQAKLLQLIQSGRYYPLGATTARRAEARIIVATHEDLPLAISEGRFREDLYYRLKVLEVRVPPLSERPGDVAALAQHFCGRACQTHRLVALELSPPALTAIELAEWPGNVRQLNHAVEAAVLAAHLRGGQTIEPSDLFPEDPGATGATEKQSLQQATHAFQRRMLEASLRQADWNVSEVARSLDVARSHVYNLIKAHQLRRVSSKP